MAASLAGAAATAGLQYGVGRLLGGSGPNLSANYPTGRLDVATPGGTIRGREGGTQFTFGRSSSVNDSLSKIGQAGDFGAARLDELLGRVRPGFGDLTTSRVAAVRDRADAALSDLRSNLARRRIAGSSFANDSLVRAEREFAREEQQVRAEAFLQEIDLTSQLLTKRTAFAIQGAVANLEQSNFETGLTAQLASSTQATLASVGDSLSQLLAQGAQMQGDFTATTLGPLFEAVGNYVANG